jgi:8-amino-7-oxononanoate synthase
MGTLSKAIGGYGGYLCASRPVIDLMKTRARTLIYSTALPPAMAAAAIAALKIIESEPELTAKPLAKARAFTSRLGLSEAQSPIVPLVLGAPDAALQASNKLAEQGFLVTPIRPPTVPVGTARLRFAFTAMHPDEEIARLADAVRALIECTSPRKEIPKCPQFS